MVQMNTHQCLAVPANFLAARRRLCIFFSRYLLGFLQNAIQFGCTKGTGHLIVQRWTLPSTFASNTSSNSVVIFSSTQVDALVMCSVTKDVYCLTDQSRLSRDGITQPFRWDIWLLCDHIRGERFGIQTEILIEFQDGPLLLNVLSPY